MYSFFVWYISTWQTQIAFIVFQFECVAMGYSCVVSICKKNGVLQQKKGVGHLFNMFPSWNHFPTKLGPVEGHVVGIKTPKYNNPAKYPLWDIDHLPNPILSTLRSWSAGPERVKNTGTSVCWQLSCKCTSHTYVCLWTGVSYSFERCCVSLCVQI